MKVSKPALCESTLVDSYKNAHREVFGNVPYIAAKHMGTFLALEDDLRDARIPFSDYADTVVLMLHTWAVGKRLKYVPVPVFAGKWAMSKFMKVWNSDTVVIEKEDDSVRILYSELTVARRYIDSNLRELVRFRKVVEECKPLLCEEWLEAYKEGSGKRPIDDALDILSEEYAVRNVNSYDDIIAIIIEKAKKKSIWKHTNSTAVSG